MTKSKKNKTSPKLLSKGRPTKIVAIVNPIVYKKIRKKK